MKGIYIPILQLFCGFYTLIFVQLVKIVMRILVGAERKALVNCSTCAMSTGTAFENWLPKVLLCAFQTVVKIAYNLSTFTLHQTR